MRATTALTIGFAGVFLLFGLVVSPVAGTVQAYVPAFTVVLGLVLVVAGGWVAIGRSLPGVRVGRRRPGAGSPVASWRAMTGFGASYALASLGCTIAPFLAVVVTSFRSSSPLAGAWCSSAATRSGWVSRSGPPPRQWRCPAVASSPGCGGRAVSAPGSGGGRPGRARAPDVAWYGSWELRVLPLPAPARTASSRPPVTCSGGSQTGWPVRASADCVLVFAGLVAVAWAWRTVGGRRAVPRDHDADGRSGHSATPSEASTSETSG